MSFNHAVKWKRLPAPGGPTLSHPGHSGGITTESCVRRYFTKSGIGGLGGGSNTHTMFSIGTGTGGSELLSTRGVPLAQGGATIAHFAVVDITAKARASAIHVGAGQIRHRFY